MTENTVLSKIEAKTLTAIVKDRKYLDTYDPATLPEHLNHRILSTESCLELINKDLRVQAINQFILNLQVKELKGWTKVIDKSVLTSKNINNPDSSTVMKKRLKEEIYRTKKLEKYIDGAKPTRKLLRGTLECMGNEKKVVEDIDDGKKLTEMMLSQLYALALQYILEDVSLKTLQQMVVESKLNIKSNSKSLIVRHLVEMKDYKPKPKKEPKNKRPPPAPKSQKPSNPNARPPIPRKPKPADIELIFTDDDSTEWNPKSVPKDDQKDIEIGKMDGEKLPDFDPLFDSYSTDYSEDPDYDSDEKKKKKEEKETEQR